jgi:UDP-N-acetylmuramoylalanine--D-glutamate ligase
MTTRNPHTAPRTLPDGTVLPDRVTVVGAARSGRAAARLLASYGTQVFVTDSGPMDAATTREFAALDVAFEEGGHTARALDAGLVVTSPGVPPSATPLKGALAAGTPIWSELELASRCTSARTVAITGSNGKTTTTELLGHVFRHAGWTTHVCGNVGTPFSDVVLSTSPRDMIVLEVSSYQLEHVHTFRPDVSVLLNLSPDHLDRYGGDIARYAATKFRMTARQTSRDACVYNADDPRISAFVEEGPGTQARPCPFGLDRMPEGPHFAQGTVRDGRLVLTLNNKSSDFMQLDELALRGRHNVYNSLAAAVAARVMEVRSDLVRESLRGFSGVPHRLEPVRTVGGVMWVNDSKATNVNAVWYALESFQENIVLIAGGRDKSGGYEALRPLVEERVRALVTIGEASEAIQAALGDCVKDAVPATDLKEAVHLASLLANPGDVVLLSPACSSFDMFDNFEHRGDTFRQLVSQL